MKIYRIAKISIPVIAPTPARIRLARQSNLPHSSISTKSASGPVRGIGRDWTSVVVATRGSDNIGNVVVPRGICAIAKSDNLGGNKDGSKWGRGSCSRADVSEIIETLRE